MQNKTAQVSVLQALALGYGKAGMNAEVKDSRKERHKRNMIRKYVSFSCGLLLVLLVLAGQTGCGNAAGNTAESKEKVYKEDRKGFNGCRTFAFSIFSEGCGWRDLNPHALRHRNLNPARLPIPSQPPAKEPAAQKKPAFRAWSNYRRNFVKNNPYFFFYRNSQS